MDEKIRVAICSDNVNTLKQYINSENINDGTVIQYTIDMHSLRCVKFLLDNGAEIHRTSFIYENNSLPILLFKYDVHNLSIGMLDRVAVAKIDYLYMLFRPKLSWDNWSKWNRNKCNQCFLPEL